MNVPLKKRHNYGKMNGSASSSKNGPNAKPASSYDDSDQQSSYCIEIESSSNEDIQANMRTFSNNLLQTQAKSEKNAPEPQQYSVHREQGAASTEMSSSSSVLMTSSADKDPSSDHDDTESESTSDSNESGDGSRVSKTKPTENESQLYTTLLTENSVKIHEYRYPPMSTIDRINYWRLSEEFSEIEDDFDAASYASKPIRSERLQKLMYKRPASVITTATRKSRKSVNQKDDSPPTKKQKVDDKTKSPDDAKSIKSTKSRRTNIWKNLKPPKNAIKPQPIRPQATVAIPTVATPSVSAPALISSPAAGASTNNITIEKRETSNGTTAIRFRVSYNKTASPSSYRASGGLNDSRGSILDTSLNHSDHGGCRNCRSKIMNKMNGSREEFYKYLGIDTNPPEQTATPTTTATATATATATMTANDINQQRRSLRVFIQQKQIESITKSNEELRKISPNGARSTKSSRIVASPRKHFEAPRSLANAKSCPALNEISSTGTNIKLRRSYEPAARFDGSPNNQNKSLNATQTSLLTNRTNKTEFGEQNRRQHQQQLTSEPNQGPSSSSNNDLRAIEQPQRVRIVRRRNSLLPSPMMLDQMFKRYKKCIQQGFVIRNQLQNQQFNKKIRRPVNKPQSSSQMSNNGEGSASISNLNSISNSKDCDLNVDTTSNATNGNADLVLGGDDHINTFSPASLLTYSNASTDSAIAVHTNGIEKLLSTVTIDTIKSLEWHKEQARGIDKSKITNPLNMKNGSVRAILTHSRSPNQDDVLVVVQDNLISFWQVTSRALCMFGLQRAWRPIGDALRVQHGDIDIPALYQHRLIDVGYDFPVYVELRVRKSPADRFRQCCLSCAYLNLYFVKSNEKGQPQVCRETVNLDTFKCDPSLISFIALKKSPNILVTWTELNVNNETRCGIMKYTLKTPTFDKIVEIYDYNKYLQHDIKTLFQLNDYHVVGCGDRTISMWDHQSGQLLIDFEIDLPTIGRNIGCYTVANDTPDYMLLIQLTSANNEQINAENLLKVMAVQTVDPYNWRTLHSHDIPDTFGMVQSIFNNDNMLTISFTSGTYILLNILSPHQLYVRNVNWLTEKSTSSTDAAQPILHNGNSTSTTTTAATTVAMNGNFKMHNTTKELNLIRLFAQPSGQIIELCDNNVMTKSIWEYFVEK